MSNGENKNRILRHVADDAIIANSKAVLPDLWIGQLHRILHGITGEKREFGFQSALNSIGEFLP